MDKSDFKVIYNLVKNYNENEFKNILKKINDESNYDGLESIISRNGKESVIDVISKVENFYLENYLNSESSEMVESKEIDIHADDNTFINGSATSSDHILDTTPFLSQTSDVMVGGSETSSDHILDTTPYLSETSIENNFNEILEIDNEINKLNELAKETKSSLNDKLIDSIDTIDNMIVGFEKKNTSNNSTINVDTIDNLVNNLNKEKLKDANKLVNQLQTEDSILDIF